jgi:C4-dicarboxylate-specific signal transduction histidine kinase
MGKAIVRTPVAMLLALLVVGAVAAGAALSRQRTLALGSSARNDSPVAAAETSVRAEPVLARDGLGPLLIIVALGGQAALIGGLFVERRRRREAERETERHLEEYRQLLVIAAHLDRQSALADVTAAIAHELNQPIDAILHNAEAGEMMLASGTVAIEELRAVLGDIRRIDMRAGDIIRRMRALLSRHELENQTIDVNELARDTVAIARSAAALHDVRIEFELTGADVMVLGDRVHLQQVLLNVLLNGIEATAALPPERRHLVVCTDRHDRRVAVSVRDGGDGIPAELVAQIFEPFCTTKGKGMGIGLSIARAIVEAHRGDISARNNDGGGATVSFTLPVGDAA